MKSAIQWARDILYIVKVWIQYMVPIKLQEAKKWLFYYAKKIVGRA